MFGSRKGVTDQIKMRTRGRSAKHVTEQSRKRRFKRGLWDLPANALSVHGPTAGGELALREELERILREKEKLELALAAETAEVRGCALRGEDELGLRCGRLTTKLLGRRMSNGFAALVS